VNFSFTCPYCGVVTYIDHSDLGASGQCRECGADVTVPFPEKIEAGEKWIGASEVIEIADADTYVSRSDLRGDESRYEPSKFWGIPIVVVALIMSGRAALQVFAPHRPPMHRNRVDQMEWERKKLLKQLQENNPEHARDQFQRISEAEFQELKSRGRFYPVESSESILPLPQ
jgi:rRNA maturation protein Nop10